MLNLNLRNITSSDGTLQNLFGTREYLCKINSKFYLKIYVDHYLGHHNTFFNCSVFICKKNTQIFENIYSVSVVENDNIGKKIYDIVMLEENEEEILITLLETNKINFFEFLKLIENFIIKNSRKTEKIKEMISSEPSAVLVI